jgi:hypothetical protein
MTQRPGRTLSVSMDSEPDGTIGAGGNRRVGDVRAGNNLGCQHGQRTADVTEAWLSTR